MRGDAPAKAFLDAARISDALSEIDDRIRECNGDIAMLEPMFDVDPENSYWRGRLVTERCQLANLELLRDILTR